MNEKKIGVITHYFGNISVGIIQLSDSVKVGDSIHIKGVHDDFGQTIGSIQIEYEKKEEGNKGDFIGIKVAQKVHPHDRVYLVTE